MISNFKKNISEKYHGILISILLTLILANPFILFLLVQSAITVIFIVFTTFLLLLVLFVNNIKDWVKIYAVNLLVVGSLLISFEVVYRYCFPDYIIEDLYTIKYKYLFNKPNIFKKLDEKEYSTYYITNKQGFRIGGLNNSEKEIKDCDWLFIGDSFTQGAQVNFEELYTSLLYREFPDKIIVNAGISGLGIGNEYYLFNDIGKKLKPKIVFLQLCNFNDFMNVEPQTATFVDYLMSYSDLARSMLYNLRYVQPDELPIGRWTEPFYKSVKDNSDYNIFYSDKSEKQKKDIADFAKYLIRLNESVKSIGAKLVVIQIPNKEQIYFKDFKEIIDNYKIDISKIDLSFPNKLLHSLTDKYGIKLIDPLDSFSRNDKRLFFEYDEHLNIEGHKFLAKCISDNLNYVKTNPSLKLLSNAHYGDRYPQLNKNGDSLVYQTLNNNVMEIYLSDIHFNSSRRLTVGKTDEIHPVFSSDDKYIAFSQGNQSKFNNKIQILSLGNNSREIITDKSNEFGAIPCFSPNGEYLAYAGWNSIKDDNYSSAKIILYSISTKKKKIIVDNNDENWRPVFSPDGNSLAYISKKSSNYDIFLYDLKSTTRKQITNTEYEEWDPSFSPDGSKIVFARNQSNNWDLYEINLTNLQEKRLTNSRGDEWDPIYSRDGKSILYSGDFGIFGGIFTFKVN